MERRCAIGDLTVYTFEGANNGDDADADNEHDDDDDVKNLENKDSRLKTLQEDKARNHNLTF